MSDIILKPTATPIYELEAEALFARMTVQPDSTRKRIISETIFMLKANGIWTEMDCCWFFAAADEQSSLLNWKGSSFDCTKVSTPTFTTDQGFSGGATTKYLTTNFNPSTNATKYVFTSASMGYYSRTAATGTDYDMGAIIATFFLRNNGTITSRYFSGQSPVAIVSPTPTSRMTSTVKINATIQLWKDGVSLGSGSASNSVAPNSTITIMQIAGTNFSAKQFAFAFLGSGRIDQTKLYNIVQFYLTQIGAAV